MSIISPQDAKPVGVCRYCNLTLYHDGPIVRFPDGGMSHFACEVDATRRGESQRGARRG